MNRPQRSTERDMDRLRKSRGMQQAASIRCATTAKHRPAQGQEHTLFADIECCDAGAMAGDPDLQNAAPRRVDDEEEAGPTAMRRYRRILPGDGVLRGHERTLGLAVPFPHADDRAGRDIHEEDAAIVVRRRRHVPMRAERQHSEAAALV